MTQKVLAFSGEEYDTVRGDDGAAAQPASTRPAVSVPSGFRADGLHTEAPGVSRPPNPPRPPMTPAQLQRAAEFLYGAAHVARGKGESLLQIPVRTAERIADACVAVLNG